MQRPTHHTAYPSRTEPGQTEPTRPPTRRGRSFALGMIFAALVLASTGAVVSYRGVSITSPDPSGAAGLRYNNNYKILAETSSMLTIAGAPDANDDSAGTNGNGVCREGTTWRDSTTGVVYQCIDDTATSADWVRVARGLDSSVQLHKADGTITTYVEGNTDALRGDALENAVAAASANETIVVGPGTYAVTTALALPAGSTLTGSGENTVISRAGIAIQLTSANSVTIQNLKVSGQVDANGSSYLTLRGIYVDGNSQTYCVYLHDASHDVRVYNSFFKSATSDCFRIEDSGIWNCKFQGNRFSYGGGCGLYLDGTAQTDTGTHMSTIIVGNTFDYNSTYGIWTDAVHDVQIVANEFEHNTLTGLEVNRPVETTITNNFFEYNWLTTPAGQQGMEIVMGDTDPVGSIIGSATIANNTFQGEVDCIVCNGTAAQAYQLNITDNLCVYNGEANTAAIRLEDYREDYVIKISGNILSGRDTGDGIVVDGQAASTVGDNLMIAGNVIREHANGIVIDNTTDVLITNNQIYDCTDGVDLDNSGGAFLLTNTVRDNTTDYNDDSGSFAGRMDLDQDTGKIRVEDTQFGIGTEPAAPLDIYDTDDVILAMFEGKGLTYHRIVVDVNNNCDAQLSFMENASTKWTIGNDGTDDSLNFHAALGIFDGTSEMVLTSAGNLTTAGTITHSDITIDGANGQITTAANDLWIDPAGTKDVIIGEATGTELQWDYPLHVTTQGANLGKGIFIGYQDEGDSSDHPCFLQAAKVFTGDIGANFRFMKTEATFEAQNTAGNYIADVHTFKFDGTATYTQADVRGFMSQLESDNPNFTLTEYRAFDTGYVTGIGGGAFSGTLDKYVAFYMDDDAASVANIAYMIYAEGDSVIYHEGSVAIGTDDTPDAMLEVKDLTFAPTGSENINLTNITISDATGTTEADDIYAVYSLLTLNDSGETVGHLQAIRGHVNVTAGDVGDGQEDAAGGYFHAQTTGGTVEHDLVGFRAWANGDTGIVDGTLYGGRIVAEAAAGMTRVDDFVGLQVWADADEDPTNSAISLHIYEGDNIDKGIYQEGTAPNEFGGNVQTPGLVLTEVTGDPSAPAEGEVIVWRADGTGSRGDAGDVVMATTDGGTTKFQIIFDFSAATAWGT